MKNKVLVKIIFPETDSSYDIFIPVNEQIWKIKKMIVKSIGDLNGIQFNENINFALVNKKSGGSYDNNVAVIDTDIRNSSELILISAK